MAQGINTPIPDINTSWENYLGTRVEEFIKFMFNKKAGCFYYDQSNSRYIIFASEATRDEFLADSTKTDLILGFFDAPSNYTAEINLISANYVPVLAGATGNYIEFTFDIKNKSGQSVGEDVICTYTFTQGANKKVVTQKYRYGTKVRFNVDDYLSAGTNLIAINISGVTTIAATTVSVTYQVVDLQLTDSMDISRVYSPTDSLEIPYTVSGYGTKIMEWIVDDMQLDFIKSEDEINEVSTSRVKYIPLDAFGPTRNIHYVQFRVYTVINGEKFYSETFYRQFMVQTKGNDKVLIAFAVKLPVGESVDFIEGLTLKGITQYTPFNLQLAIFNPTYAATTPIKVLINDELNTTLSMSNGTVASHSLIITSYGDTTIKFQSPNSFVRLNAEVEKSSTTLEEITQGLSLDLQAIGKSNASADYNSWKYNDITTAFTNFDWTEQSGWGNNRLNMRAGAAITISHNPLASDVLSTGKTLEFEFSTSDVSNNDAVICSLLLGTTGLLITASEASLTSASGAKVSTKYKSGENIRLTFVINRRAGVINKCLVFLYVNGILSGATNFPSNDNFIVSGNSLQIKSSAETSIELKALRFYNTALSSNQVLNNYMLYRDTADEMLQVYMRNSIYEEGSSDFSVDTLSGQLPVMLITGNIPALEATTDKNLQIDVDVEYINLQDPTRSFTLKNGALRPQGTSSMSYPKKNFRLYTNKKDNTILYNAEGEVVSNRLYSFKQDAQPVDCWCMKADYAESSGTHNTGVARIWNDVLKNAVIDGEYKLRTQAQKAAINNSYPYDVRTTVDGFPILMFYRLDENSPYIFIGKYNFNNDKSTESVFGFRDIPGFDNSRMQCWELLNNGHHLGLFNDTNNWNTEWPDAFEGRYPDGNTNTADLKAFADWMSAVSQSNFATEKWDHFNVHLMAAYYVYIMRCGAVDQTVKNSMLTSEDGEHWYFINYDNDTIFGVRNDGLLIYPPTIDRQTLDTSFSTTVYAYAGHDSRLWNLLEADEEFMEIVREVDQALYIAGFSYNGVINMFDVQQAEKWCERIYNQDAEYKYIGPFTDRGVNNLFMLQGSRSAYRRWWVSERFALLDSKYVTGEYKANSFEAKLAGAPIGLTFDVKAGADLNYGYGVNNVPIEYGVELEKGKSHTFTTQSVLNVGDPLRIYAAPYIEEINISSFAPYLAQIAIAPVYSERLGTKLKKLIMGNNSQNNNSLNELSGINQAETLTHLDITNFKGLTALDLSRNTLLETLNALGAGLTSVVLPKSAPIKNLWLPSTLQFLKLDSVVSNLPILTSSPTSASQGLYIEGNGLNITDVEIFNCPNFDSETFVKRWLNAKTVSDSLCKLVAEGIDWEDFTVSTLIRIKRNFREISLKGVIHVPEVTSEQVTILHELFGNNCFSPQAELFISAPAGAYIIGPTVVNDITETQFSYASFGADVISSVWQLEGTTPTGVSFTKDGLLTVTDDFNTNTKITLKLTIITSDSQIINVTQIVAVKRRIYPYESSTNIVGEEVVSKIGEYAYDLQFNASVNEKDIITEWSITQTTENPNLTITLSETSKLQAKVIVSSASTEVTQHTFKVNVTIKKINNSTLFTKTLEVKIFMNVIGNIIMTSASNPNIISKLYNAGLCANPDIMTDVEAALVTDLSKSALGNSDLIGKFHEFVHFINVPPNKINAFYLSEITCPWTIINAPFNFSNKNYNRVIRFPNLEEIVGTDKTNWQYGIVQLNGALKEFDAPKLRKAGNNAINFITTNIYGADSDGKTLRVLNLPKLEIVGNYGLSGIFSPTTEDGEVLSVILPSLRQIGYGAFSLNPEYQQNTNNFQLILELPNVRTWSCLSNTPPPGYSENEHLYSKLYRTSSKDYGCFIAKTRNNPLELRLPNLEIVEGTPSAGPFAQDNYPEYLLNSTIFKAPKLSVVDKSFFNASDYRTPYQSAFEFTESLDLPGITKLSHNSTTANNGYNFGLSGCSELTSFMFENAVTFDCFTFNNNVKISSIYFHKMPLFEFTGGEEVNKENIASVFTNLGSEVPEGTQKIAYLPTTFEPSDTDEMFIEVLTDLGFTISQTL